MLGGRAYRSAAQQTTFAQDGYVMGVVRTHQLDDVINRGEDLLAAVFSSGSAASLLSGVLVEDGQVWSRERAIANARHFDALTAPEDKAALLAAMEGLLAGFFLDASPSSTDSPTSSGEAGTRRRRSRRARTRTTAADTGSASSPVSPTTTANG